MKRRVDVWVAEAPAGVNLGSFCSVVRACVEDCSCSITVNDGNVVLLKSSEAVVYYQHFAVERVAILCDMPFL